MDLLRILESIRTPVGDAVMAAVTHLGGESAFLLVSLAVLWCVNKRQGYFILLTSYAGLLVNQFLKLAFRIPRPWVQDPNFTIVEAARAEATGYSFPSGHTANIVCLAGAFAGQSKRRIVKIACAAAIFLVAFSRMYLGVHTPLDVAVALICSACMVFLMRALFQKIDRNPSLMYAVLLGVIATAAAFALFVHLWPFPADIDANNLLDGQRNACSMLGAALGLLAGYFLDQRYVRYSEKARWWAQAVKFVLGVALILGIKTFVKQPLASFLGDRVGNIARYFIIMLFASGLWPMTFAFFSGDARARAPRKQARS